MRKLQSLQIFFIIGLTRFERSLENDTEVENSKETKYVESCRCMEYWQCLVQAGQPYSYCGISDTEVCCFFDEKKPGGDVSLVLAPFEPDPICGRRKSDVKNLLDSQAKFGEWPWHVAILEADDDLYICGGSIISDHLVLTAAHCIHKYSNRSAPRLKIRAGEYDISTNSEPSPHVEVVIDMIGIHPDFNSTTLVNDIAVVGMTERLNFSDNIQPVCLPEAKRTPAGNCIVTGWGRSTEIGADYSIVLKEVVVPLWDNDRCEKRLRKNFGRSYHLAKSAFCGDDGRGLESHVCDGDGGGPLVCFDERSKQWVQEGIVSFGLGCGRRNSPGVYSKVSSFVGWIQKFF